MRRASVRDAFGGAGRTTLSLKLTMPTGRWQPDLSAAAVAATGWAEDAVDVAYVAWVGVALYI